ncbi:restriction endonuclease subunit S [Mesorhizobium sp. M0030]|uniref:restriction endonuclease subunit S n=1 Tax=Mesorhizobium sp. M0030 TaxID=2956851 RepID=UPI0033395CC1
MSIEVPGGWRELRLGDLIATLDAGVSVNADGRQCEEGEVGVLKTSSVSDGRFIPEEHKAVLKGERSRVRVPVRRNSLIFSRMNTPNLVGANAYIEADYPKLYLPDRLWQIATNEQADCRWLSFHMQSEAFRRQIDDIATGTSGSMKNISKGRLNQLPVLLPPLEEQRRIAEVLRSVDEAIETANAVIAAKTGLLDTLRRDTFAAHPESVSIEDLSRLVSGQHVPTDQTNDSGDGVPYLTGPSDFPDGDVVVTKFTTRPLVMCEPDDILITVKGSGVGKSVIADQQYCISRQLMALRTKSVPVSFLFEAIQTIVESLNSEASGPIPGITRAHILTKRIPAINRSMQQTLGDIFGDLRGSIRTDRSQLARLFAVKAAASNDLLSGRVRAAA